MWCASIFCATAITVSASAQVTSTWQANGVAAWNDPANWTSGVPNGAGDHAIFGPTFPDDKATVFIADPTTIVGNLTYDNPFQIVLVAPTVSFEGDGSAALIEVLDGQVVLNSGNFVLATDLDLSVASGSTVTVGVGLTPEASFSGPGGLNVLGGGGVILTGASSYLGATHIRGGIVTVNHDSALGTGTGTDLDGTFIHAGGTLELATNNLTLPNEKIMVDGGTLTGDTTRGQDWTLAGPIQLDNGLITGGDWTIDGPLSASGGSVSGIDWQINSDVALSGELTIAGGAGVFGGIVSGSGGLRFDDAASQTQLPQANTYAGRTVIQNGTVHAFNSQALGAGTGTDADGTVIHSGGRLIIGSYKTITNEKITLLGGVIEGSQFQLDGPIVSDGGTLDASGFTINSDIDLVGGLTVMGGDVRGRFHGNITGAGPLVFNGGLYDLHGSGSYTGQTQIEGNAEVSLRGASSLGGGDIEIDAGELWVIHPESLDGAGRFSVLAGGELVFVNDRAETIDVTLSDSTLRAVNELTLNGQVELADGTNTVQTGTSRSFFLNSTVSGVGDIRYNNNRIVYVTGDNTYTGETIIDGDSSVLVQHANALGDSSTGTTILRGSLRVEAATNEPIVVRGGDISFSEDGLDSAGLLTLAGGRLSVGSDFIYSRPIYLEPGLSLLVGDDATIAGGASGVGDLALSRSLIIQGAPLAHDGDLVLQDQSNQLNTPNTYSGLTHVISNGGGSVNHADALGTNDVGTIIDDGSLILNVVPDEEINILDGILNNRDINTPMTRTLRMSAPNGSVARLFGVGTYSGQIVLSGDGPNVIHGGVFNGEITGDDAIAFSGETDTPVYLNNENTYTGITEIAGGLVELNHASALGTYDVGTTARDGLLKVNVVTPEPLFLSSRGTIELNVQLPQLPEILPGATGAIRINTRSQYDEHLGLDDFELRVGADTDLAAITMRGESRLLITDGASLNLTDGELKVHSGRIMGDLSGIPVIRKETNGRVYLREAGGLDGTLIVDKGVVWLEPDTLTGSPAGTIEFTPDRMSGLWMQAGVEIDAEVFLNNNHGYDHRGVLYTLSDSSSRNHPTFNGDVHLGDIGSTIGGEDGMIIAGAITGGDLTVNLNRNVLYLTTDTSTYTGITDLTRGKLLLQEDARLSTTEKIIIGAKGSLGLSNHDTQLTDRVADDIPIEMYGGSLSASVPEGTTATETLGDLTLVRGYSEIDGGQGLNILTFKSLTQDPSATLLMHIDEELQVFFEDPPEIKNGILGGSVFVRGDDNLIHFATYNPALGVHEAAVTPGSVNTAGPGGNIVHTDLHPVVSADATINSVFVRNRLDLGGHTLRVQSGGIISAYSGGTIINGNLTAGDGSGGTLYMYGGITEADITDDGDAVVNLNITGGNRLSGINTYTGSTTFNKAGITIETETALPEHTDITLNAGSVEFDYTSTTPRQLGTLTLRDDAEFGDNPNIRVVADFQAIELEAGTIEGVELVGSAVIRKTTVGTASILGTNSNFEGSLEVHEGTVSLASNHGFGSDPIKLYGGVLSYGDQGPVSHPIRVYQGTIAGGGDLVLDGLIEVMGPTTFLLTHRDMLLDGALVGDGPVIFDMGLTDNIEDFLIKGDHGGLTGDITISGGRVVLHPDALSGIGSGSIAIHTGGQFSLQASSIANDFYLQGGDLSSGAPLTEFAGRVYVNRDSRFGSNVDTHDLILSGGLTLLDDTQLVKIGETKASLRGEIQVGRGSSLLAREGTVALDGVLVAGHAQASLDLIALTPGSFEFNQSIHVQTGHSLAVTAGGAVFDLTLDSVGQHVTGGGVIHNGLTLSNGASINPGSSAGTFTVDGDYTQLLDALMQIELGGAASGEFDRLVINGLFSPGGVFELLLLDDYMPSPGDMFDVLDFSSLASGQGFDQLRLPELYFGRDWDTSKLLFNGEIRVVPEPAAGLGLGMLGVLMTRGWARQRSA